MLATLLPACQLQPRSYSPLELARHVLIRARMCERLARKATIPPDEMFTAGLLSLLDRPLTEIIDQLMLVRESLAGGACRPARIVETARPRSPRHACATSTSRLLV